MILGVGGVYAYLKIWAAASPPIKDRIFAETFSG